jgi:hypothetical protein
VSGGLDSDDYAVLVRIAEALERMADLAELVARNEKLIWG